MVLVSINVWPLTWLDRLTHFLGAAWKFYGGLWHVWSAVLFSTTVHIHDVYTGVVTPDAGMGGNRGPGWHGEAGGRVSWDCLQMLFRGALCLFNKRMWNINLPSPLLHCIICEVTHEAVWFNFLFSETHCSSTRCTELWCYVVGVHGCHVLLSTNTG